MEQKIKTDFRKILLIFRGPADAKMFLVFLRHLLNSIYFMQMQCDQKKFDSQFFISLNVSFVYAT